MKTIDPTERFAEGHKPAPLPPTGPDGGLQLAPASTEPLGEEPIYLCQLGPCVNFHVLALKIDAQEAIDGSRGPTHAMTIRTCYPAPGIEVDLAERPVRECSRWQPQTPAERRSIEKRRSPWTDQASPAGGVAGSCADEMKQFNDSWTNNKEDADGV